MAEDPTVDDEFARAVEQRSKGNHAAALQILLPLESELSNARGYLAVVAHSYWQLSKLDEAIAWFQRATEVAPSYEKASLGLFHCLYEKGLVDAAFDEWKRFARVRPSSPRYAELMKDLRSELEF